MPPDGATFDESSVPLGQGGTSGGFWKGTNPPRLYATLSLRATPPTEGIFGGEPGTHSLTTWSHGMRTTVDSGAIAVSESQ